MARSCHSRRERREAAETTYHCQQPDTCCSNCRESHLMDGNLCCALLDDRQVADLGLCAAWQGE